MHSKTCSRPRKDGVLSLPNLALKEIGNEEAARLEETFSEEEIWAAISGLNSEKAPGPDGFPLAFWSFS